MVLCVHLSAAEGRIPAVIGRVGRSNCLRSSTGPLTLSYRGEAGIATPGAQDPNLCTEPQTLLCGRAKGLPPPALCLD